MKFSAFLAPVPCMRMHVRGELYARRKRLYRTRYRSVKERSTSVCKTIYKYFIPSPCIDIPGDCVPEHKSCFCLAYSKKPTTTIKINANTLLSLSAIIVQNTHCIDADKMGTYTHTHGLASVSDFHLRRDISANPLRRSVGFPAKREQYENLCENLSRVNWCARAKRG